MGVCAMHLLSKANWLRVFLGLVMSMGMSTLWGQATSSVRGKVSDSQGAAIQSAVVSLQNAQTGFRRGAETDPTGVYQFLQVPPGTYTVVVEKTGFAVLTQAGVELLVNTPVTLNPVLQVASVTQTVDVEADVVKLNTVDEAVGNAFNEKQARPLSL